MRRALCVLCLGLLALPTPAAGQPGCRTVVFPALENSPTQIATVVTVPPTSLVYPFNYVVPDQGLTTGVETVFHRLVTRNRGAEIWTGTAWRPYVEESVHVLYYQVLPYPVGTDEAGTIPYLRTQHHSTRLEEFQNLSVVLQPPKGGRVGEGWNVGVWNANAFPIQLELQVFMRECVTP